MLILLFVLFFLGIIYLYLTKNHDYWRSRGIAYTKPIPIFGSLLSVALMRKSDGELMNDIYKKFKGEKVVGVFLFRSTPALVIRDPSIIHNVLVKDFHHFANNDASLFNPDSEPVLAKNIFFLKDELWKHRRSILSPAFTSNRVKYVYPQMTDIAKCLKKHLEQHPEEVQVKEVMTRYTGEIVARCVFGIDGRSFTDSEPIMNKLGKLLFGQPTFVDYIKFMTMMLSPALVKTLGLKLISQEALDLMRSLLSDIITYRKEYKEERHDIVQFMIDLKEKSESRSNGDDQVNGKFNDEDILAGCVMLFLEGYEASSAVLSHVLYNLAMNRNVQEKLQLEIDETFRRCKEEIPFDTVAELPYLNEVLLESNRIFPALFGLGKICTEKYEMDLGRGKMLVIEKDTTVFIPTYAINNDPMHWSDVEQFKPERFANNESVVAKNKGIFLPFGDGPRMCIGVRLAMMLFKVALIHVLHDFEVVPSARTPLKVELDPMYFMLAHKGGLYLKFVKRNC